MTYYHKYQKDRNEKLHSKEVQRERIIEWYNAERDLALNRGLIQVKKFVNKNDLDLENSITEYIRRQVLILKEIRKKIKGLKAEDIRNFFIM